MVRVSQVEKFWSRRGRPNLSKGKAIRGSSFVLALLCGLGINPHPLQAAESDPQCIPAFEKAQRLRKEGKLIEASEALITCSRLTCHSLIAKDCTDWYGEVQASLPSVVVSARVGDELVRDVRVYVDGALVSGRTDGRAIPLDPGTHEFKFEIEGKPPLILNELIIEGEKSKPIVGRFPAAESTAPPPAATVEPSFPSVPPPPERGKKASVPIATYAVGGVGVLAIGGAIALRLKGAAEYKDAESSCKPDCSDKRVDKVQLKYTLSDIGFGVGAAALVTAGVLYWTGTSDGTSAVALVPSPRLNGGSAVWLTRF